MTSTLLGLFRTREEGLRTLDRLREDGFAEQIIQTPEVAAGRSRDASGPPNRDEATGAAIGALAGGLVGSVPGALLGALGKHGLSEVNARWYERTVAEGGMLLVMEAREILPAARGEDTLRRGGVVHVHTGEVPST
jgi:hypothetical protein